MPVLPKLVERFVGGDTARAAEIYGLFGTVWAVTQFFFAPVLGALSDRFGRRPVILLSNFGLGLDYVFDREADDLPPGIDRKDWWPPGNEYGEGMEIVPPEPLPEITEGLLARNYSAEDVAKILGGNMARVAKASWGA